MSLPLLVVLTVLFAPHSIIPVQRQSSCIDISVAIQLDDIGRFKGTTVAGKGQLLNGPHYQVPRLDEKSIINKDRQRNS